MIPSISRITIEYRTHANGHIGHIANDGFLLWVANIWPERPKDRDWIRHAFGKFGRRERFSIFVDAVKPLDTVSIFFHTILFTSQNYIEFGPKLTIKMCRVCIVYSHLEYAVQSALFLFRFHDIFFARSEHPTAIPETKFSTICWAQSIHCFCSLLTTQW